MEEDARAARREALIQGYVKEAVGKWEHVVPSRMLAKLRQTAENYYRTHPVAVRIIDVLVERTERTESGLGDYASNTVFKPKKGGAPS